jgi:hypothetical protein
VLGEEASPKPAGWMVEVVLVVRSQAAASQVKVIKAEPAVPPTF